MEWTGIAFHQARVQTLTQISMEVHHNYSFDTRPFLLVQGNLVGQALANRSKAHLGLVDDALDLIRVDETCEVAVGHLGPRQGVALLDAALRLGAAEYRVQLLEG